MTNSSLTPTVPARSGPFGGRRNFVSIDRLEAAELNRLVDRAVEAADDPTSIGSHRLDGVLGLLFEQTSTRTRTAFSVAALRLGAQPLTLDPQGLQLRTGESIEDTARVFGLMLDGIVIRTKRTVAELDRIAAMAGPIVVNAMAAEEHPTQAICDLATIRRRFGSLAGISVLYVGEGNNTAWALALALARVRDARLCLLVPPGFGLAPELLPTLQEMCRSTGATVRQTTSRDDVPAEVDVVYTTRWQTTGTTKANPGWREVFRPYHVDRTFLRAWPAAEFMHDLPAHRGDEVSGELLESPTALVWQQAEMKLYSAMAVLEFCWRI